MDVDKRLLMIRLNNEMNRFPELSEKLGLVDNSTYRGEKVCQQNNTPHFQQKSPHE